MTDEQVIQALRRCGYHTECCYCNSVDECGSKRALGDNCLDLINRKDAEIEKLNVELVGMRGACGSYKIYYNNAQEEIERLKEERDVMHNDVITAEKYAWNLRTKLKTAKSEAYKEFAERLKEKAMQMYDWNEYIEVEDIDNTYKELTEGGNEDE